MHKSCVITLLVLCIYILRKMCYNDYSEKQMKGVKKMSISLRCSKSVDVIINNLMKMEIEFKRIMNNGTEEDKDRYLEKALREVEQLRGKNATYRMWYMAFCDIRDGFTK